MLYTGDERRLHPRYGAESMTVSISFQDESSGKIFVEKVQPVDFNISGVSIKTNINIEIGSKISLNVSMGKYRASNIISIVRNVIYRGGKNRYGLQFDFTANDYMCSEELGEILSNIEYALKKNHKYPQRTPNRRPKKT